MSDYRPRWYIFALHVFALSGFALAQPLYDWISREPEFLAAHGLGVSEILLMVVLLSLGIPLLIIVPVLMLRILGRHVLWAVQLLIIGLLCGLLALEFLPALGAVLIYALACAGAVAGAVLYWRWPVFRSVLSVSAVAAIVFPVVFIATDPVRSMLSGTDEFAAMLIDRQPADDMVADVDVIYVMLDELPLATLLDESGNIDARHFPNFARLSGYGTWYRNAATVHFGTTDAVPAALTGLLPDPEREAPYWRFYEENLFMWAARYYGDNIHALEAVTRLCPAMVCMPPDFGGSPMESRLMLLLDLGILYGWRILPEATASSWLPSIEDNWNEFAAGEFAHFDLGFDRVEGWQWFVEGVGEGFNFKHLLLPHLPHAYLPDGSTYRRDIDVANYSRAGGVDGLNILELQRYLAQARFTDRLLGELLDRLEASGRWDNTLLVVTADHGRSFRRDSHWRALDSANLGDVLGIPLFIKYPGQNEGRIDERPASLIDIPPTIADVSGRALYWEYDGASLAGEAPPRDSLPVSCKGTWACMPEIADKTDDNDIFWLPAESLAAMVEEMRAEIRQKIDYVEYFDLHVPASPFTEMLGQPVADYAQAPPLAGVVQFVGPGPMAWVPEQPSRWPVLTGVRLEQEEPATGDTLMMAVNGRLAGVGEVVAVDEGDARFFAALFPRSVLRPGRNEFTVYEVKMEDDRPRLRQLQAIE